MRAEFCQAMLQRAEHEHTIFLTGDLGFMALESLQDRLGARFINAGVAEQNMISVAAAMAKDGWQPWCYSIAPFCFARPYEQIRNDVCLHDLPVRLVGNGGGYGYGVMGPTHHAVEDYGVMMALPEMCVFIPAFDADVGAVIEAAAASPHPTYVRLGRGELARDEISPTYAPWRRVLTGDGPVTIAVGPIAGSAWQALRSLPPATKPDLWILAELPVTIATMPPLLLARLAAGAPLLVVEEHIEHSGVASMVACQLLHHGLAPKAFHTLNAAGLRLGTYGSQQHLRKASRLSPDDIRHAVLMLGQRAQDQGQKAS